MIDADVRRAVLATPMSTAALRDHVLLLFRDVLAGLVELREADVVHMDIKPHNVMACTSSALIRPLTKEPSPEDFITAVTTPSTRWQAFIIDLGISRSVAPGLHGLTSLVTDPFAFSSTLLRLLGESPEHPGFVARERLREYAAFIDLSMFGRVIWFLLMDITALNPTVLYLESTKREEAMKVQFWKQVFRDDYDLIAGMAQELVLSSPRKGMDTGEALRRLQTIPLHTDKDIYSSSILTDRHSRVKIRCGKVLARLGSPLDDVVNHPHFQRLRRMAQLAFVSEVFPEATHTRFSHSLRTFELAKEAVTFLTPKSLFRLICSRRDVDHLLAAALLHDIGQYPFAHTIEDLRELGDKVNNSILGRIRHDHEMVEPVISNSRVSNLQGNGRSIRDILEGNGFNVADILFAIAKDSTGPDVPAAVRVSHDLIAKVIDLDRIAYLLQDSERSGVPYGNAVDVESLLDSLTIAKINEERGVTPDNLQLGMDDSGVSAAEAMLAATYWMYRNVYWCPANRAFMSAIKTVVKELMLDGHLTFEMYWDSTFGRSERDALGYLHDLFEKHRQEDSVNPLANLVQLRRIGYSRVMTIHPIDKSAAATHGAIMENIHLRSEEQIAEAVEGCLRKLGMEVPRHSVLVDIPLRNHLRDTTTLPVIGEYHLSRLSRPKPKDLLTYSDLASQLMRSEEMGFARVRVFIAKDLIVAMSPTQKARVEDELLTTVRAAALEPLKAAGRRPDTK